MRPFERLPAPDFLAENWERWSLEYEVRKTADSGFQFSWHQPGYRHINRQIKPLLQTQTDEHCSYCDFYPARQGDDTIEHFKPKGQKAFYRFAYQWENLYFCCWHCQKAKGEQFDDALLRPDEPTYSFEKYFIFKFSTGEISVNPVASEVDKHRAEVTIKLLKMNEEGQMLTRKREWQAYDKRAHGDSLGDYAFRFLFE